MRVANDGPMYAVIGLVGALALSSHATSAEMVITSLAALLARSWPRAVTVAGSAAVALFFIARTVLNPQPLPPAPLAGELRDPMVIPADMAADLSDFRPVR